MTCLNLAQSTTLNFLQVGHTHTSLDQKFSVLAAALAREPLLQTPEDCALVVEKAMAQHCGPDIHLHVLWGLVLVNYIFVPVPAVH